MSGKAFYRRVTAEGIGPGGWKCPCCAPAPGQAKKLWKRMGKKQRVAFEKCSKFIDEGLEMKFGLTTILAAVILLSVTACGQLDRELASMTGSANKTCIDGVTYLQFTNGATVQVDQTGKPVACK